MHGVDTMPVALAIILAPIVLLWIIGRFVSRWLARNAPKSQLISRVGPMHALTALITVLTYGSAVLIRAFEPTTSLGQLFNSRFGLLATFAVAWIVSLALNASAESLIRTFQRHRGGV